MPRKGGAGAFKKGSSGKTKGMKKGKGGKKMHSKQTGMKGGAKKAGGMARGSRY